ncbi:hypothetical protein [Streptomyces sp. MST-110588]|uniref:hypothetical protein n=1 Tax=Streptomyces sp. MST-110588 TaxID=2833628 RepID=UPI001F5CDDED|nr:hypothetical protein [Streptomyces sp. MST-110588]UNO43516.1 hypothetical protein KGS77_33635 [Streptomyces sp. MST-110588]
MTTAQSYVSADDLKELLGEALHAEVVTHFTANAAGGRRSSPSADAPDTDTDTDTDTARQFVERQVLECLRYLYLVSKYRDRLSGLFLPVEQEIDEIWHYLILQTREYRALCEQRLPGRFFVEHRSIAYEEYQREPGREQAAEEALRWVPLYCREFGPFDEGALPHWTIVRFLHHQMDLTLEEISALEPLGAA